jgi:glycosyltransferase involved in cell wall biosynthesis
MKENRMQTKTIAVLRSNPKDAALARLVKILSKQGHVDCFLWDRQGDFQPAVTNDRIRYVRCGIRAGFYNIVTLFKLFRFQWWLFYKLMTTRCDVIHAIDLDTGLPGRLAARLKGKKFVYQCLDPYYAALPEQWPRFLARWARRLENRLIAKADLFVITDQLRMPQHEGAKPRLMVEVANVPFLPQFSPPPSSPDVFTVGYLGSLIEGRDLLTAIDACGELEKEGVRLVIGSFGPLEKQVESHAEIWPNVTFRKWVPSYEKMLEEESSFDLFFHITDPTNESQKWVSPNKLFEAMAFSKPIIVSKDTLAARRVEAFGNGVAVTYGSKIELQDAILRFKNDPDLAREMGERGREEFQRNWRPEFMEKRLLDAYGLVLGAKSHPRIRIAHVVGTFPPYKGGMGNTAAQFAKMHSCRHEVTVLTPRCEEIDSPGESPYQVEWLKSPFKLGNAAWLPQLLWRLRSFDIVHLHYPFYGAHLMVFFACILWRRNLVLHYHMDSLSTSLRRYVFEFNRRMVFPLLARRADVIIGASLDYLANSQVSPFLQASPGKFYEIPFWVDSERFHPGEKERTGEVVVLFVAALDQAHYFKGLEILLRAMKDVVMKSAGPISLRVVGGGDLLTHYQRLAAELKISDRVQFLGKVDDEALVRAYREASFLVLPSINQGEAFGLVLLEAMSSGKPVIASNLPGVRSVFTEGQEGLLVEVGDTGDLAEKILKLAEDEAMRDQMGRRGRELVMKKYQAELAEQELEDICQHLVLEK